MRRLGRVGLLAAAIAGAIPAGSAAAGAEDVGTVVYGCEFSLVGTTQLIGFDFTSQGAPAPSVCTWTRVNSDGGEGVSVATVDVSGYSSGNLVCGTGVAPGQFTLTGLPAIDTGNPSDLAQVGAIYQMTLVRGHGTLYLPQVNYAWSPNGTGLGYADMIAEDPGVDGTCVAENPFRGRFRMTWALTFAVPLNAST